MKPTIGILGAGKVGIVLAQLGIQAGYKVLIAGSGDVAKIALPVKVLAPGAEATTKEDLAAKADVIILALPLSKYMSIPKFALTDKLVIDAMNHWLEADGSREDIIPATESSSEFIQSFLEDSRVVKAFSHLGYHELFDWHRPAGDPDRKAIAIAGNSVLDTHAVASIVDDFGFDPLLIGDLGQGIKLEPGHPGFARVLNQDALSQLLR